MEAGKCCNFEFDFYFPLFYKIRFFRFQVSPGHQWIVDHFQKSIENPTAQSMANEMFSSGLIPAGTDFVIFQNYQDENKNISIPGLDFAHFKEGYK